LHAAAPDGSAPLHLAERRHAAHLGINGGG